MVCVGGTPLVGQSQILRYGTGPTQLTVTLESENYRATSGPGYMSILGYDRVESTEYLRTINRSTQGTAYWQGPSFDPPHDFTWSLQLLTDTELETLWAMHKRQQRDRLPVRLIDTRLAYQEPSPRTRAKSGNVLTPVAGMVSYFAQFDIQLILEGDRSLRRSGYHDLSLRAVEMSLVPTSEDIA
jgi:hypothetical protein